MRCRATRPKSASLPVDSGPTEAYEVTPAGAVTWHLIVDGVMTLFRVEPINSFEP
jgi:hypothetical protein